MNIRFLRTMVAISQYPSFFAAGEALGLSHSAVSVHVKSLEDELQITLVDRSRRPPVLTDKGIAMVEHAKRMLEISDEIKALASEETLIGRLSIGVVPSSLINLVPPGLAALRQSHPRLQIRLKADLSQELAQQVRNRDIDVAIVTEPGQVMEGLRAQSICEEPLNIIAPASAKEETARELLSSHPFIWFNRRTWAGQQIERHLIEQKIHVQSVLEVDTLEAIESLVRNGIGISIAPKRVCSPEYSDDLKIVPLGEPQIYRELIMVDRINNPRAKLVDALYAELVALVA
ncbi:LysR substrate-binding domain-containing protein [Maritalea porphyrae]|jgi:DNA-binding transcriptional LysR family regulator|uniref:LysR substrate-binding domain-containing protein n=1 Tax=Maritalea porphyrae TaxID=880732 RepID=UPI0022AE7500|nr:LysR substrate-binding domain-containing protein [Maritalea porphyrae]MCZ4271265.1 LysR substrate-binding domain-containing protein [Maritalea porphyrae]